MPNDMAGAGALSAVQSPHTDPRPYKQPVRLPGSYAFRARLDFRKPRCPRTRMFESCFFEGAIMAAPIHKVEALKGFFVVRCSGSAELGRSSILVRLPAKVLLQVRALETITQILGRRDPNVLVVSREGRNGKENLSYYVSGAYRRATFLHDLLIRQPQVFTHAIDSPCKPYAPGPKDSEAKP